MSKKENEAVSIDLETASKEEVKAFVEGWIAEAQARELQLKELNAETEKLNEALKAKDTEILKLKAALDSKEVTVSSGKKSVDKKGNVKVRILLPVSGKFLLPYNVNQVVALPEKQAEEIVEARYGEYV